MTRIPLLAVCAVGATLVVAPAASAMPLGAVRVVGEASHARGAGHPAKARCAHNGVSTNKVGHTNCRARKPGSGDSPPVTAPAPGDTTPTTGDTPPGDTEATDGAPTTSSPSDQGDQDDQGDQNDQGDPGSSSDDQGDRSASTGDQGDHGDS